MARCRCTETVCSCVLAAGDGISIAGTGTQSSPWIITALPRATDTVDVQDTLSLDLTRTGRGIPGDPYVISGDVNLGPLVSVVDTPTVDLTLGGSGTLGDPFTLTADAIVGPTINFVDGEDAAWTSSGTGTALDPLTITVDVPCLHCDAPGNVGDVLALQADGTYLPSPPVTAPVGAIFVAQGLIGDGSAGNPLRLNLCTYDQLELMCATP